ncbi:plasmid replication protein RepC [Cereibacter sp. SYSU M97828]|nr:plasmid replication protein RepC [Cereibacter flavus]
MRANLQQQATQCTDQRWVSLRTVQAAMVPLGLKDRDIAVLRGLLSFISPDRWEGPLIVFASNNALRERCDGIDERTLRRRISRLCELGLIKRQQSPNRKRYVVRSSDASTVLAYGFDLAPLRSMISHLETLATQHARLEVDKRAMKAIIRDRLYRLEEAGFRPETSEYSLVDYKKMLRRNCTVSDLQASLDHLEMLVSAQLDSTSIVETVILTDSDSEHDRDIHSSKKEYYEERKATCVANPASTISIEDCIERAPSAMSFSSEVPKSWSEIRRLAQSLAPAIGINDELFRNAMNAIGPDGTSLAVIGLVQAYPSIKHPVGYLKRLVFKAEQAALNVSKMFKSLTSQSRFPAGNHVIHAT